jgi:hypothetical protein
VVELKAKLSASLIVFMLIASLPLAFVEGCSISANAESPGDEAVEIVVTAPFEGQLVPVGENLTVNWTTTGPVSYVSITLLIGTSYCTTLTEATPNDGQESFAYPGFIGTEFMVRVTDTATSISGYSPGYFTLGGSRHLTITSPIQGDYFAPGETITIAWTSLGAADIVGVRLICDMYTDGTPIGCILVMATDVPNVGFFNWTVVEPEIGYAFKIYVDAISVSAESGWFSIKGRDRIWTTNPDGLEAWRIGEQVTIGWEARGTMSEVGIDLYRDGSLCRVITNGTPSTWSFPWFIPNDLAPGEDYQIHMYWTLDPEVQAFSPLFTLLESGTAMFHAHAGFDVMIPEGWTVREDQNIVGWVFDVYIEGPNYEGYLTNILIDSGVDIGAIGNESYLLSLVDIAQGVLLLTGINAVVIEPPSITTNGSFETVRFTLSCDNPASLTIEFATILSITTGRFWMMAFAVATSQIGAQGPVFDSIVETFQVTLNPPFVLDFTRFRKDDSFQILMPSNWTVLEDQDVLGEMVDVVARGPICSDVQANINVVTSFNVTYTEDPVFVLSLADQVLESVKDTFGIELTLLDTPTVVSISGHAAVVFTTTWPSPYDLVQKQAFVVDEASHRAFNVVCTSHKDAHEALQPTFDAIITGFQVIDESGMLDGTWFILDPLNTSNVWDVRAFVVDGAGHNHLCYVDTSTSSLIYSTNDSGSWTSTSIAALGNSSIAEVSIAVDPHGNPHIAYYDVGLDGVTYVTRVEDTWTQEIVDSGGLGLYPAIALGAHDRVYIAYIDYTNDRLILASNGSGSWNKVDIGGAALYSYGIGIAVDEHEHVHLSYMDSITNCLMYATNASGEWVSEPVDGGQWTGQYPSLRVASNGVVHICYVDNYHSNLMYAENSLGHWVSETVDSSGEVNSFGSMVLDSADRPHIAYHRWTESKLLYGAREANGWNITELNPTQATLSIEQLALDAHDRPRIAFASPEGGHLRLAVLAQTPGRIQNISAIRSGPGALLLWDIPDDDGGMPVNGYVVYRGTTPSALTPIAETGGSTWSFFDSNVTLGQMYYYRVAARNVVGVGGGTPTASVIPATVPTTVRGLATQRSDGQVSLSWLPPLSSGGLAITGYTVYRSVAGGEEVAVASVTIANFTDVGLANGQIYRYRVSASNPLGEGEKSGVVHALPAACPSDPRNLTVSVGDGFVRLTWLEVANDGGLQVTNYTIYRGSSSAAVSKLAEMSSSLSYFDSNVTNGQIYYYVVSASNEVGEGATSAIVTAEPKAAFDYPLLIIGAVIAAGAVMATAYLIVQRRKK